MTGDAEMEALMSAAAAFDAKFPNLTPVRQRSANGQPPARSEFNRRCKRCGADFLGLAAGKTGERGLWGDSRWWCSQECFDFDHKPVGVDAEKLADALESNGWTFDV